MAIQVGGTTVINNSRALSNIASVDATTAASITAAGVGGGSAIWFPSSWTSPSASYTSSTTWTKPAAVTDAHTVWFYMIGGGGGGGAPSGGREDGGGGGNAVLVCAFGASLPSSVTLTIGSGGSAGSAGNSTSITVNGVAFSAAGGIRGRNNLSSGQEQSGPNGSSSGKNFAASYSSGGLGVAYDFSISGYFGAGGGRSNADGGGNIAGGFLGGSGGRRWQVGNAPGGGGGAEYSGASGGIYIFWGLA
jgi:hypothetical protein